MIIDNATSDFYQIISNIKIRDIIMYYFILYIFISVAQTVLRREISLDNLFFKDSHLKINPKIKLTLVVIYIFGLIDKIVINLFPTDNFFHELLQAGILSIIILKTLEVLLYGLKKGKNNQNYTKAIIPFILKCYINNVANLKTTPEREPDKDKIKRASALAKNRIREKIDLFFLDLILSVIVITYAFSINILIGFGMTLVAFWFLIIHLDTFKELKRDIRLGAYGPYYKDKVN